MPHSSEWIDPEVFLVHRGTAVFHTYKDDDRNQGRRTYWFTLDPLCGEASCDCEGPCRNVFDVHSLPTWNATPDEQRIEAVVREAIERGLLAAAHRGVRARKADCLVLVAPEWFQRPDFIAWRSHPHVTKWAWADEGQDTFLVYDGGDLSDDGFLPKDIEQAIHAEAGKAGMEYGTIWIKSV